MFSRNLSSIPNFGHQGHHISLAEERNENEKHIISFLLFIFQFVSTIHTLEVFINGQKSQ